MRGYNFNTDVRKVLERAREEAARLQHEYVGTEHIVLGLLGPEPSIATEVLRGLSADPDAIRQKLEEVLVPQATVSLRPALPYTSRSKKILELAMSEARELGDDYVGTEHLLLGVIREERGIGAQVLTYLGLTRDAVRAEVLKHPERARHAATLPTRSSKPGMIPLPAGGLRVLAFVMSRRVRSVLGGAFFGVGAVWATAAALKLVFGIRVAFPLLPPIGLEQVDVAMSLVIALGCAAAGAMLRRQQH